MKRVTQSEQVKATINERRDAMRQIEELANNDCYDVILSLFTDDQIKNLAADFNEGKD